MEIIWKKKINMTKIFVFYFSLNLENVLFFDNFSSVNFFVRK